MVNIHKLYFSVFFSIGIGLGGLISCAPTKFSPAVGPLSVCDSATEVCQAGTDGTTLIVESFRVGAGKVDILFVIDNSASMSVAQVELGAKFSGFIAALDSRDIDYRIGITTTDLVASQASPLIAFSASEFFIGRQTTDRIAKFRATIKRQETGRCENFIRTMYLTHGNTFQSHPDYVRQYDSYCPTGDTRGVAAALNVIKSGSDFIRSDANLSIILISNDEVRGGRLPLDPQIDSSEAFLSSISNLKSTNSSWTNKFVEFNSIVTLDAQCASLQENSFVDFPPPRVGTTIRDSSGRPVIRANPGAEYVKLSSSASQDVDGNPRTFGIVKSICESDFTNAFKDVSTNISDSSRLMGLNCNAVSAPKVTIKNSSQTVPFLWKGDRILFQRGSEGLDISVEYKCKVGQVN